MGEDGGVVLFKTYDFGGMAHIATETHMLTESAWVCCWEKAPGSNWFLQWESMCCFRTIRLRQSDFLEMPCLASLSIWVHKGSACLQSLWNFCWTWLCRCGRTGSRSVVSWTDLGHLLRLNHPSFPKTIWSCESRVGVYYHFMRLVKTTSRHLTLFSFQI